MGTSEGSRSGKGEKEGQVVAGKSTSWQEVACSSLLLGRELILRGMAPSQCSAPIDGFLALLLSCSSCL